MKILCCHLFRLSMILKERKKRLKKATFELSKANEFDRVLLNDNLEKACQEAKKLVLDFIVKP